MRWHVIWWNGSPTRRLIRPAAPVIPASSLIAVAVFDPADEVGLANRLSLNIAVDPAAGGEVWRLRDGLGAATPGFAGDATLLNELRGALDAPRVPSSGSFGTGPRIAADLFTSFSSSLATTRASAEQDMTFTAARVTELTQMQLADGVDTDQELQNLLVLERAYAANARVMKAADEMLEQLTRFLKMNISSLGDLAQSYAMKSRNTALKSDLQRLVQEVTTGQVADKRDVVTSNAAYVSDLERSLTKLEGYELATFESGQHAAAAQSALDRVSTLNAEFRDTILVAGNMGFWRNCGEDPLAGQRNVGRHDRDAQHERGRA